MKKTKKDDSGWVLRERVYQAFYPSADKSYDILAWIQNKDYSCSLQSSQKLEIDRLLNISVSHIFEQNHELLPDENQKQLTNQLCSASKSEALPEQKSQIKNQINTPECELNEQQIKQSSPSKVEAQNQDQGTLSNFPSTFQAQSIFIQDIIEKYSKKREQNQSGIMPQQKQIISPQTTDTQFNNSLFDFSLQTKPQVQKKIEPSRTKKKQGQKCRISQDNSQSEQIQEKDKLLSQSQSLCMTVFNLNQKWVKMKKRKDARKYEIYQTQLYQDFFKRIPLILHQSEGEIKLDEPKKRDNQECQQFELLINPKILIGPLSVNKCFKLHIRFKKGYQGQVFYDNKLQNTIPNNTADYITIEEQPIILANNSDNIVKLVCCLIFDITK